MVQEIAVRAHIQATNAIRPLSIDRATVGPSGNFDLEGIHWVIVGGESGPRARPMEVEWAGSPRPVQGREGAVLLQTVGWAEAKVRWPVARWPRVEPMAQTAREQRRSVGGTQWQHQGRPFGRLSPTHGRSRDSKRYLKRGWSSSAKENFRRYFTSTDLQDPANTRAEKRAHPSSRSTQRSDLSPRSPPKSIFSLSKSATTVPLTCATGGAANAATEFQRGC